ncbi:T9SS type A sorting domain-containing protein [Marivirga arenosa]|uniref:T9SS type A sorting domain-containing protein n=1 Tax=Marivirga arenosa TaxID=3059076 RepID=A0AA51ZW95_9BACT|nr:T9SS type A sorting domain-containing protein [Marivirga sp. BKB1-2]WNB17940.1 T9SS type A sorting domain-containing protein [Marivirga sp. BKB1-2]
MKKPLLLFPAFLLILSFCFTVKAQVQEWQSIQSFPDSRSGAVSFVIGDTAYVGTGYNGTSHLNSFYKYNADDANWRSINNFPGAARKNAVAFVADAKAYVGTGTDGTTQLKDFYEYDPSTGNWSPISDLPGEIRNQASSFSINNKGYVGLGGNDTGSLNDFYEYDPVTGAWEAIASLPESEARSRAVGFSANGKGYIASGVGSIQFSGMYSYDPVSDSWSEEIFADSKLSSLQQNTAYTDADGLVHILNSGSTKEQVVIDPTDNTLTTEDAYFTDERNAGVAFFLNGEAYAGIGLLYDEFGDAIEKNSFQKLVTIYPPEAPTYLHQYLSSYSSDIGWFDNSNNEDGFLIYLSENDNQNYEIVDTVTSANYKSRAYKFDNLKRNVNYYVKVAAYNKGGVIESDEISFIPLFETGKLNTPELLEVSENKIDSGSIKMQFNVLNNDIKARVIIEISYDDGSTFEEFLIGGTVSLLDTRWDSYLDSKFKQDADLLKFRVKVTTEGREDSDYSNIISFDTEELKPEAPQILTTFINSEYPKVDLEFVSFNNLDSLRFVIMVSDTIYEEYYGFSNRPKSLSIYDKDSINIFAINQNVFGIDTSNIVRINKHLLTPTFTNHRLTSNSAVEFGYSSNIDTLTNTVIERSIDGEKYEIIDTVRTSSKYEREYVDPTVEPNTRYYYRLRSINEKYTSLYSKPITANSQKTASWDSYRENSLSAITDSLEYYKISNIDHYDDKLFFVSTYTKKAFYFDLNLDKLISLPDIPLDSEMKAFSEVAFANYKAYFFTPEKIDGSTLKTIFVYDLEKYEWTKVNSNISAVKYASQFDENKIVLSIEEGSYSYEELIILDTKTNKIEFVNLSLDRLRYIGKIKDSLIAIDADKQAYMVDKSFSFKRTVKNNIEQVPYKNSITELNGQETQIYNGRIYNIDFTKQPFFEEKEVARVTDEYEPTSLVFSYQDTLVYMQQYDQGGSWINNFYYKNDDVLNPLVGFNVDSVGYETFDISWADSPDEEAYIVECYKISFFDNSRTDISLDTLEENTTSFRFTGLAPSNRYVFRVFPIKGELEGDAGGIYTRTLEVVINPPKNIQIEQNVVDSLKVSWELSEPTNMVDSIYIMDYIEHSTQDWYPYRNILEIKSNGKNQSLNLSVHKENSPQFVKIRAFNKWKSSDFVFSDTILTHLNSPQITEVAYFEKEGKYQLVINDKSDFESKFHIYKRSAEGEQFELLETIEGNQPNEFTFDDFIDDPSITYEYYVQSYLVEDDSVINSSFPSNIASTGNAVLSNTPLKSDELNIFPNPVTDYISITSNLNIQLKEIEVLSLEGRLIKIFKGSESIDVSELEKGIYLLKIKAKSGEVIKRFIKE